VQGMARPVGELPASVYWRRRIVVIALVVLVGLVAFFLIRPLLGGSTTPVIAPVETPEPSASTSPSASALTACSDLDMAIEMSPSPRDFAAGSLPLFEVSFVHTGFDACSLDTGAVDVNLLITSGSDRIWNSADCPGPDLLVPQVITLEPDRQYDTAVSWPRERSNTSCSANLPSPLPGTYHAFLTVQGVESNDTVFTLSN